MKAFQALGVTVLIVAIVLAIWGITVGLVGAWSHVVVQDQFRHAYLDCARTGGHLIVHGSHHSYGSRLNFPSYRCAP